MDEWSHVVSWQAEETVIPYIKPTDMKTHRYFMDVTAEVKTANGGTQKMLIEVKPFKQTQPPKARKRPTPKYLKEALDYSINQAKWDAARKYAAERGYLFVILTEKDLKMGHK